MSLMRIAPVLLAASVCVGCGYQSPALSSYLKHIETIRIPPVVNQTASFELGDEMTTELQSRFRSKWRAGDDSTLLLTALDYEIRARTYDVNNLPEQYRMSISVQYEFIDNVKRKLIKKENGFQYHRDFYAVEGAPEPMESEEQARAKLIDEIARALYSQLAEQW